MQGRLMALLLMLGIAVMT